MSKRIALFTIFALLVAIAILWPSVGASGHGNFAGTPTPNGGGSGKIAFTSNRDGNLEIYVMDADGNNQTRLTHNEADDSHPAWSPDGKHLAFASWSKPGGDDEIYVMDADGGNQRNLTNNPEDDNNPAWSPDGKYIAFDSNRDGNGDIYVMDADGGNPHRLTKTGGDTNNPDKRSSAPVWSPDGKHIAFMTSDGSGKWAIFVMDADGRNLRKLTNKDWPDNTDSEDIYPHWSPDGKQIAFASDRNGKHEIFLMNADGSNQHRLADLTGECDNPAWSPDGKQIVFRYGNLGGWEIWLIDADGKNPRGLTQNQTVDADDENPTWQPAPK